MKFTSLFLIFSLFGRLTYEIKIYDQRAYQLMVELLTSASFVPIPKEHEAIVPFYFLKDRNKLEAFFKEKWKKIYCDKSFEGHFLTVLVNAEYVARHSSMKYEGISGLEHTEQADISMSLISQLPRLGPFSFRKEESDNLTIVLVRLYLSNILRMRYINLRRNIYAEPSWIMEKIDSLMEFYVEELFSALEIFRKSGLISHFEMKILMIKGFETALIKGNTVPLVDYEQPGFRIGISPLTILLVDQFAGSDFVKERILTLQKVLVKSKTYITNYEFFNKFIEDSLVNLKETLGNREFGLYCTALAFYMQSWNHEYYHYKTSLVNMTDNKSSIKKITEDEGQYLEALIRTSIGEKVDVTWWEIKAKYISSMIVNFSLFSTINERDRSTILSMYQTVIFKRLQLAVDWML